MVWFEKRLSVEDVQQKRLGRFAVPLIAALVLLSFASMTILLVQIAHQQDKHAAWQAQQFARSAMERRRESIAKEVKDYAAWGEAYQHLHLRTDIDWAFNQSNLGATLYQDLGYDDVLVIGPTGAVTYAVVDGKLAAGAPPALLDPGLRALVEAAGSAPPGESKPAVGIVTGGEVPLLVAASAITTGGDPTIAATDSKSSIMVFADALTPARLNEIGAQSFVTGLRTSPSVDSSADDRHLVISTADQSGSVTLRWDPEEPGNRLLWQVLPWLVAAGAAFIALIILVLRRTMRTALKIEAAAHALAEAHRLADHLAHHDGLTLLPNRLMLFRHMQEAIKPTGGLQPVAVVYIDLDRFKPINDAFGHQAGDRVLQLTAARLRSVLHDNDMAARVGGDEFVLILAQIQSLGEVQDRCRRVIDLVREPMEIEGRYLQVGLSLGIVLTSTADHEAEELLRRADMAMYQVKTGGGNDLCMFSSDTPTRNAPAASLRVRAVSV